MPGVNWLPEPTPAAVADALATVAPHLAGLPVTIPDVSHQGDPRFHAAGAALGDEFIVKFAWSKLAAERVRHQITVLDVLARDLAVPYLPEVVAAGAHPLVLVTRRVRGTSLFAVADSIDRDRAGEQIARFLTALHADGPRRRFEAVVGPVPAWYPLVTTDALRERFGRLVTPAEQRAVERWCDWTDGVLAAPGQTVLVHGDFHGDNQVWSAGSAGSAEDAGELQAVIDFENVGLGEPEYELRTLPGPGLGPDLELLTAVMRCYEERAGRALAAERILAWHVRQALGDVLWRSEAGLRTPDGRPPGAWVGDIAVRLSGLGITV
jgi:aminoglycoside phosphotransferase (APT) family kinase protein